MIKKPKNFPENIVFTDADGLTDVPGDSLVVLLITRNEIESGNYASALERLIVIAENRENARRYKEMMVLVVTGYDGDERELAEIPEVRLYFSRLTNQWPHWFWFLHRGQGLINLILSLICEVKVHRKDDLIGFEYIDHNNQFKNQLRDLTRRSNALFDAFNITIEESEESLRTAISEIYS